ncbi:MAG: hypothetical protein JWQ71_1814 [Pedosphaera sp.]|nr:hypothetical protein [Pedosphaera sp.]
MKGRYLTKAQRIVGTLSIVFVLGLLALYVSRPKEPAYQGKTLTEWMVQLEAQKSNLFDSVDPDDPRLTDCVTAIKAIGTNGIPNLLSMLNQNTAPRERLSRFLAGVGIHMNEASGKSLLAIDGFTVLGETAKPAAPKLHQLATTGPDISRINALQCLIAVKADREDVVPCLIHFLITTNKIYSRFAAGELHRLYPEEAEKAGVYKLFPQLIKLRATNNVSTNVPSPKK